MHIFLSLSPRELNDRNRSIPFRIASGYRRPSQYRQATGVAGRILELQTHWIGVLCGREGGGERERERERERESLAQDQYRKTTHSYDLEVLRNSELSMCMVSCACMYNCNTPEPDRHYSSAIFVSRVLTSKEEFGAFQKYCLIFSYFFLPNLVYLKTLIRECLYLITHGGDSFV